MSHSERLCDVMPCSDDYEAKTGAPAVQVATGHTNMRGERFILTINEDVWLPNLENSLMNPNQLRDCGIDVNDNPHNGEPMTIRKIGDDDFVAGFKMKGTNVCVDTWTPTNADLEECPQIVLTSPHEWNPHKVKMPGVSEAEIKEIETRGIGSTRVSHGGDDNCNGENDPHFATLS